MLCVTSGGRIAEIAKSRNLPLVSIPSGYPPRSALGFSLGVLLRMVGPSPEAIFSVGHLALEFLDFGKRQPEHCRNTGQDAAGKVAVEAGFLGAVVVTVFQDDPGIADLANVDAAVQFEKLVVAGGLGIKEFRAVQKTDDPVQDGGKLLALRMPEHGPVEILQLPAEGGAHGVGKGVFLFPQESPGIGRIGLQDGIEPSLENRRTVPK